MILILGAPRSGTTWLASIFDSHEDVLYRHEPDIVVREPAIPSPCERAAIPQYRADARAYLTGLAVLSLRRTVGPPLFFRKNYRSAVDSALRLGRYSVLRALAQGWPGADAIVVPDKLKRDSKIRLVIKSVSACGRAGLYAEALPEAHIFFIMRNPFGQVASMLRGTRLGRLDGDKATELLWQWPETAQYGITRETFEGMPLVERLAWLWALHTEKALDDLEGRANVRIVCYETLCRHPRVTVEGLFEFSGLMLTAQTERFLRRSTREHRGGSYFSVFKDTQKSADRWQLTLSDADRATIRSVVGNTKAYSAYRALLSAEQ